MVLPIRLAFLLLIAAVVGSPQQKISYLDDQHQDQQPLAKPPVLQTIVVVSLLNQPFGTASPIPQIQLCKTSTSPQQPGTVSKQTLCSNIERSYLLYLPNNYDSDPKPRSLILSYHGGTKNAEDQLALDEFTTKEYNNDFIVVYPQGIMDTWQGVPDVKTDDLRFTTDLLNHLTSKYRVDPKRIYATGKSQGGGLVGLLACDATLSKRIAAFAPVSASFYTTTPADKCQPAIVPIVCNPSGKGIPFIEFHGGKDDVISYEGDKRRGVCLPSIPHYLAEWAKRNGLSPDVKTTTIAPDTEVNEYAGGLVKGYINKKIGHDWPSTKANPDNTKPSFNPASYNASPIIMDFFRLNALS